MNGIMGPHGLYDRCPGTRHCQAPSAESLPGFVAAELSSGVRQRAMGYGMVEPPLLWTAMLRPIFVQHDRSRPGFSWAHSYPFIMCILEICSTRLLH